MLGRAIAGFVLAVIVLGGWQNHVAPALDQQIHEVGTAIDTAGGTSNGWGD